MDKDLNFRISLQDLFSGGIQKAHGHAQHFEGAVGGLSTQISHLREEIGLAIFAFEGFETLKEMALDFVKLEQVGAQLQFTVGKRGGLAGDFNELTEQSEKLGKSSFFNNREIQTAANQLLNYGVSVKQTKESLQALTDVGVAKGKSLSEVISAAGMAAAGGRAMALKEYGLGFLKLEKDMSVAGAEARNFNKIIAAMKHEFAGATDAMSGKEFFKIKKIQDELEEFREKVGRQLLKAFDALLPYLRKALELLTAFGSWIKEHIETVKLIAVAVGTFAIAISTVNTAFAIGRAAMLAYTEMSAALTLVLEGETVAQVALNAAMLINPYVLAAAGIALIATAWYNAAQAYEEYDNNLNKRIKDAAQEEDELVSKLAQHYIDLGKSKEEAMNMATASEMKNLQAMIDMVNDTIDIKKGVGESYVAEAQTLTKYMTQLSALKNKTVKFIEKEKVTNNPEGLGSELSQPKASRIQNITINLIKPFENQIVKMTGVADVKDLAPAFTEYLISVAQDAAIVATE